MPAVNVSPVERTGKEKRRIKRDVRKNNRVTGRDISVYAGSTTPASAPVTVECFRVPKTVEWTYVVVNSKALYNSSIATNFELHRSEEDTVVNKILELAGIVMNKVGLAQTAAQMSAAESQVQNT
jgi:hypothetical protein